MKLSNKALLTSSKKLELSTLGNNIINGERMSDLSEMVLGFYFSCCPKPIEYQHRRELVRIFNRIAKDVYGNLFASPSVEVFGSFVMDMFSTGSDLDLSINLSSNPDEATRDKKIKALWKIAKKLFSLQCQGHVSGVQTIMSARVPIVKVIDQGTGVECDLSVENRDGVSKSQIVHTISAIDGRFKKLSLLMKAWAKVHDINSSRDHTLNSLSIISLVAFHLQTRDPPILPPFSTLFKDGASPAAVMKLVQNYLEYGKRNKESLAELFITLFIKLSSVENLWKEGLCASLLEGSWISKTWDPKCGSINVEDFTNRSENVARAVGSKGVAKIYKCIKLSLSHLISYLNGQIPLAKLKELLFCTGITEKKVARNDKNVENKSKRNTKRAVTNKSCSVENSEQSKRRRLTNGWEAAQQVVQPVKMWGGNLNPWERAQLSSGWGGAHMLTDWGQTNPFWPANSWEAKQALGGWQKQAVAGWGCNQQVFTHNSRNINNKQYTPPVALAQIGNLTPGSLPSFNATGFNGFVGSSVVQMSYNTSSTFQQTKTSHNQVRRR